MLRHSRNRQAGSSKMSTMTEAARKFFELCEAGKGWEACQAYCAPDASFSAQAEPLAEITTLQGYAD
jgi:hypothetical protein